MTVTPVGQQQRRGGGAEGGTSGLYDVLEPILDRGLVIDAFIRVSLVGIEILKIDVRVVVASVDTYLRFAEACNRLDLEAGSRRDPGLPDLVGQMTEDRRTAGSPGRPARTSSTGPTWCRGAGPGDFTGAVTRLAADAGRRLRVELTGPWAPYSLTALAVGEAEGAGGTPGPSVAGGGT